MTEQKLIERLSRIEGLFAGATTTGERVAAEAALGRILARLAELELSDTPIEYRFSIPDPWKRRLFLALARRYGLRPFRYPRQKSQTVMLKVPERFVDETLWPHYNELARELDQWLDEATTRVISEAVHADTAEAGEVRRLR